MTTQELQNLVNYRRRESTESFVSNDEVLAYLNEALRRWQAENDWEATKTSTAFSYTDGSSLYAISAIASDLKFPINLFYSDDYDFEPVAPEDIKRLSATGGYNMYAADGTYFYVDTSFGTASLQLDYYSTYTAKTSGGSWIAQLSTSTDEPLMPARHQDLIVDYAAARAYQKEGMMDDYKIAFNDFMNRMEKMKREFPSRRKKGFKRMMHISEFRLNNKLPFSKSNPLGQ